MSSETDFSLLIRGVADLYGDEDEVGADSSQCGETEHVAGVHDAHDEEHRGGEQEAPKQDRLKQSVAVVVQDVYHLDVTKRSRENLKRLEGENGLKCHVLKERL